MFFDDGRHYLDLPAIETRLGVFSGNKMTMMMFQDDKKLWMKEEKNWGSDSDPRSSRGFGKVGNHLTGVSDSYLTMDELSNSGAYSECAGLELIKLTATVLWF